MKPLTERKIIGNLGEDIACDFLRKRGFRVIARNYLKKWGELDIVGLKERKVHFFEVKTVTRDLSSVSHVTDGYRAEDNMHPWKLKRLSRIIQTFLMDEMGEDDPDWQFNVITVSIDARNKEHKVEMLEDVTL